MLAIAPSPQQNLQRFGYGDQLTVLDKPTLSFQTGKASGTDLEAEGLQSGEKTPLLPG